MLHRGLGIVAIPLLVCAVLPEADVAQTATGPFARIAIMRAIEGHAVEWEEGYIRHLQWHRQAKDPFNWYSYSVWASSDRQRWIIYATFGHAAASLSNPILPADDERDNLVTSCRTRGSSATGFTSSCRHCRAAIPTAYRLPHFVPS